MPLKYFHAGGSLAEMLGWHGGDLNKMYYCILLRAFLL